MKVKLYETAAFVVFIFLELKNSEVFLMKDKGIGQLALAGLFIAFGLVLPMMFHVVGLGSTFLPMHIPVLLAGFVLEVPFAAAVGAMTPFLSSIFTGMPPTFPVMPYMVFELAVYGTMTSILYRKMRLNVYISLILGMISGRIMAGIVVWILAKFFATQLPGPVAFITGSIVTGLPGIIIQLVFIPPLVMLLQKYRLKELGDDTVEA